MCLDVARSLCRGWAQGDEISRQSPDQGVSLKECELCGANAVFMPLATGFGLSTRIFIGLMTGYPGQWVGLDR
jgi:hypothetical protein